MVIIIMLAAAGGYHDKMNPEGGCHEGRIGGRRPESMPRATLRNEALGQHYFSPLIHPFSVINTSEPDFKNN